MRDLFLVHGWAANSGVWAPIADALTTRFRVHALDLPGCGRNAGPVAEFEAAVAALRSRLTPGAAVMAWSMGGLLSLGAVADAPEAVSEAYLVGAFPKFCRGPGWPGVDPGRLDALGAGLQTGCAATLRRFRALCLAPEAGRDALRRLEEDIDRGGGVGAGALHRGLDWLRHADLRAVLGRIAAPVTLVHGSDDRVVPVAMSEELCEALPAARLLVMAGAGHAPFRTRPAEFMECVFDVG